MLMLIIIASEKCGKQIGNGAKVLFKLMQNDSCIIIKMKCFFLYSMTVARPLAI